MAFLKKTIGLCCKGNSYKRLGIYFTRCLCSPAGGTSLLSQLRSKIKMTGPLSVADYMKEVLTNPVAGYYMSRDVFGTEGDFITSPEISQVFGELIGIWCVNEWMQAGSPHHMQIVELGPGRGTLAHDMLRVFAQFEQIKDCVSLHLVEVSPKLSELQYAKLTGNPVMEEGCPAGLEQKAYLSGRTASGVGVSWYRRLQDVPQEFSCYIAHEFLDALPIYKFQTTDNGWREVLVSVDAATGLLTYVLSPGPTAASETFMSQVPTSRDHVEVCPEAGVLIHHISRRIEQDGGMALIADYGHVGEKGDTFRAFKKHQLHDALTDPGAADLTADVDFAYLAQNLSEKVASYGPISQTEFLHNMGIGVRLKVLYENSNPQQREDLISAYDMLTNPDKMGQRFKFLSILNKTYKDAGYVPAGFVQPR